jgi:hypothetical protein
MVWVVDESQLKADQCRFTLRPALHKRKAKVDQKKKGIISLKKKMLSR